MSKTITQEYSATKEDVFNAALQAVRKLGYTIDNIDKSNGLLNFKTGMSWKSWAGQEMSIYILDNGNDVCTVDISGRRSQTGVVIQVFDWGEASSIATKVFDEMFNYLASLPRKASPPSPPEPVQKQLAPDEKKCPYCAEIIKAEAKLCRYCHSKLD